MATLDVARQVRIKCGNDTLSEQLSEPVARALGDNGRMFVVEIDPVGRVGQVLISISGSQGRLPLFFQKDELEPGYVFRVVRDTVSRFGP